MAHIKIEIDTDKISFEGFHQHYSEGTLVNIRASKPIVVISTVEISKELKQAIIDGAGQRPLIKDGVDYDELPDVIKSYDGPNRLIVTTGGAVAAKAARDKLSTAYFVSLLGGVPTGNPGRCLGGVAVSSWTANRARVEFLVKKGRAVADIGLFCNRKSPMNTAEEGDWTGIAGVNQTIIRGGYTAGKNDASHYDQDFAQANAAGITTLIISASPFFFHTREKLILAANGWVAGAAPGTRHVCYPFDDYENAGGTSPESASWYGGSLLDAYAQIGVTAQLQLNSTTPIPFTKILDTSGDFP